MHKEMSELIETQADEIERTKIELDEYKDRIENYEIETDILKQLYHDGFINLDGHPIDKNA